MYGDNAIGESRVRWWFGRFRTGNFNLKDEHRSGRPSKLDNDVLATKVKERPDITTRELAEELDISKGTVYEHLVSLGYTSRCNVWVPHKLSEKNCLDRYFKIETFIIICFITQSLKHLGCFTSPTIFT